MDLVNLMNSLTVNETEEDKRNSSFNIVSANVNNEHTDIVLGKFTNRLMVIATQYEKVGSLLKVTIDLPEDNVDISDPVYSVKLLFGAESAEQEAAARYIAEKLSSRETLLIFLSLKNYSPDTVRGLAEALLNIPDKEK